MRPRYRHVYALRCERDVDNLENHSIRPKAEQPARTRPQVSRLLEGNAGGQSRSCA
jgi:hypothetical protein